MKQKYVEKGEKMEKNNIILLVNPVRKFFPWIEIVFTIEIVFVNFENFK